MADLIERELALQAMEICGHKNAAQLISEIPSASPWIPCSERMPDENSGIYPCVFIVWNDLRPQEGIYSGYPHIGFYNRNFKGWQDDSGNIYFDSDGYATHWFPMPDIPKFPKRLKEGDNDA